MNFLHIGNTGLQVSRLCLGTMTFGWSADEKTSHDILNYASEQGINFIDTADIYSAWIDGNQGGESETIIGNWLKTQSRRDIIIATKVRGRMWQGANGEGLSRHHIIQAAEDSLKRLQTDYIDLYQSHYPDDNTPLEETLAAFDHLVQSGKVRYIGTSNHPAWLLMKSLWVSDAENLVRYETLQPHYSIFHRSEFEQELQALCLDQKIGVIPYSPLAAGFATGKYTRENSKPDSTRSSSGLIQRLINNEDAHKALDLMREIAAGYNVPIAQIALAWQLAQPAITSPIIGARKVEQLKDIAGAVDVKLTGNELAQLSQATSMF